MIFDKVILYGPTAAHIVGCNYPKSIYYNTSLTVDEFTSFILEGAIDILAFESFLNKERRMALQKPELRLTEDFDLDLLNGSNTIGKKVTRISNQSKELSAIAAIKLLDDDNNMLRDRILSKIQFPDCPEKYKLKEGGSLFIPAEFKNIRCPVKHIAPYIVAYDYFNNINVMQLSKTPVVYVQLFDLENIFGKALKRGDCSWTLSSDVVRMISEKYPARGRLTREKIKEFRNSYFRNKFLSRILCIYDEAASIKDFSIRKEQFRLDVLPVLDEMSTILESNITGHLYILVKYVFQEMVIKVRSFFD